MSKFDVTPEELDASANFISTKSSEFVKAFNNVYAAVQDLALNYQGQSSKSFNEKINNYRPNFEKAKQNLDAYVEAVKTYSAEIQKEEDELARRVSTLK